MFSPWPKSKDQAPDPDVIESSDAAGADPIEAMASRRYPRTAAEVEADRDALACALGVMRGESK